MSIETLNWQLWKDDIWLAITHLHWLITLLILVTFVSALSLKKYLLFFVDQSELCGVYIDNSMLHLSSTLFCSFLLAAQTVSQVHSLLCDQLHWITVLWGCVRWREACARLCPLFIIERLAVLPADPSLPCYLRADKGGRCGEEINVNPSVFN